MDLQEVHASAATDSVSSQQQPSHTHLQSQALDSTLRGLPIGQHLHQEYLKLQELQAVDTPEQQRAAVHQTPQQINRQGSNSSNSSSRSAFSHTDRAGAFSELSSNNSDLPHPEDAFNVTSLQHQYELTLDSLQMGRSKNISQLASMFDPHAVLAGRWWSGMMQPHLAFTDVHVVLKSLMLEYLITHVTLHHDAEATCCQCSRLPHLCAAPDKGAAILEALMFGAAKLGDMQLLAQLLRCCQAAQIPLSSAGHTAVLHGLAHSGQASRAKKWLQEEVPRSVLNSHMLRAVVQPLLQQGQVHIADDILQWATGIMSTSAIQASPEPASVSSSSTIADQQGVSSESGVLQDSLQIVPCLQLMVAGAKRSVAAVQAQWAAIQQQQEELLQQQRPTSSGRSSVHHPHMLGVSVWGSYVSALCKASKSEKGSLQTVQPLIRYAVEGLADVYHTTSWNCWAKVMAARHRRQQQDACTAAAAHPDVAWWQQQQQQAQQTWQQVRQQLADVSWQQLDPAAVLPQDVAQVVNRVERDSLSRALDAALHVAADKLDSRWVEELLQVASLLKVMPNSWSFDALLNHKMWQGATPEAMEVRSQPHAGLIRRSAACTKSCFCLIACYTLAVHKHITVRCWNWLVMRACSETVTVAKVALDIRMTLPHPTRMC